MNKVNFMTPFYFFHCYQNLSCPKAELESMWTPSCSQSVQSSKFAFQQDFILVCSVIVFESLPSKVEHDTVFKMSSWVYSTAYISCLCPLCRAFMWMTKSSPAGPTVDSTLPRSFQSTKMVGINNLESVAFVHVLHEAEYLLPRQADWGSDRMKISVQLKVAWFRAR